MLSGRPLVGVGTEGEGIDAGLVLVTGLGFNAIATITTTAFRCHNYAGLEASVGVHNFNQRIEREDVSTDVPTGKEWMGNGYEKLEIARVGCYNTALPSCVAQVHEVLS
jgi:hypothetical protein